MKYIFTSLFIIAIALILSPVANAQSTVETIIIEQPIEYANYEEPRPISRGYQNHVFCCFYDTLELWVEYICSDTLIPLEYKWYAEGKPLEDIEGIITGTETNILNLVLDTSNTIYEAEISCKIWPKGYPDNFVTIKGAKVELMRPPTILVDLDSIYTIEEGNLLLLGIVSGGDDIDVYWKKDNEDWFRWDDTLRLGKIRLEQSGMYQVRVSNYCDTVYSRVTELIVSSTTDIENFESDSDIGLFVISPNPFSNNSSITLNTEQSGIAEIIISDVFGKRIALLFEGYLTIGQTKELNLNSNQLNLITGTYFITIRMGDRVETRKISVVR